MRESDKKYIQSGSYSPKRARTIILKELKEQPKNHWLLTRLGSTFYEERNYREALKVTKKALKLAPNCPLVLWDYAGALQMLERDLEATRTYKRLIGRGAKTIAHDECGEGLPWAKSLIADCYYRIACLLIKSGQMGEGKKFYQKYLASRAAGTRSIYPIAHVRKQIRELLEREMGKDQRQTGKGG